MRAQELYDSIYKDFTEWLKKKGIGDHFNMDLKMSKCFDILYDQYARELEYEKNLSSVVMKLDTDELQKEIKRREDLHAKAQKEEDKAKKNIEKTRKEVVAGKDGKVEDLDAKRKEKEIQSKKDSGEEDSGKDSKKT